MSKIMSKVIRFWFTLKLMVKLSYQTVWSKQHWIDYVSFPMQCSSFLENLGIPSQVEKMVAEDLDKLAVEYGIEIQYCVTRGEEEANLLKESKTVIKNCPMMAIPAEVVANGKDTVLICMDNMAKAVPLCDIEHDTEKTIKGMIRHEFQHILQFHALRSKGIDVAAFMEEKNKQSGTFELLFTDVMEYDAHVAQYKEPRSIEHFLHDFETEYGVA